jgi:plasmid stabilization system protein ParE
MTQFKLIIRPQVLDDIRRARNYYNTKSLGLGDRFRRTAINSIDGLINFPFFQVKHSLVVRTKMVPHFPFLIHFLIQEESREIVVLAVLHAATDPESWFEATFR